MKKIDVRIRKSKKWAKSSFELAVYLKTAITIPQKYKNKYSALVTVHYDFGACEYSAKVRRSGDWRDHILFQGGNVHSSLDVKLNDGNIASIVRFKIFLPRTRNGYNEVLGVTILRKLGYLAPRTAVVAGDVNNAYTDFILQEKPAKEFLESALRREGPIFEGDESIVFRQVGNDVDFEYFNRTALSGASLTNSKWASLSNVSLSMSMAAFERLQESYFESGALVPKKGHGFYIDPNDAGNLNNRFPEYHALNIAMSAVHGLITNNRKYYWNAINSTFEPVYYDGNIRFSEEKNEGSVLPWQDNRSLRLKQSMRDVDFDRLVKRIEEISGGNFVDEFAGLAKLERSAASRFVEKNVAIIIANLRALKTEIDQSQDELDAFGGRGMDKENALAKLIERTRLSKFSQLYVKAVPDRSGQNYTLECVDGKGCKFPGLTIQDMARVMEDNAFDGHRVLLVQGPEEDAGKSNSAVTRTPLASVVHTSSASVRYDPDRRAIVLKQGHSDDWFLIKDTVLDGVLVEMDSSSLENHIAPGGQRFNAHGLTGCLTLYNVTLTDAMFSLKGGGCEDSLNVVSSAGSIKSIHVESAFSDAIDMDFSTVEMETVEVSNAGNDCLDFSGGRYRAESIVLRDCGDKGVSVGEMSVFDGGAMALQKANIAVSSKDYSRTTITRMDVDDVTICGEAYQKKSEFGGAVLRVGQTNCDLGTIAFDSNSQIWIGGEEYEFSN